MKIPVIEEFLKKYSKEYDYYQKIASICAQQCESDLGASGIRAIVTYRAKRPDRLRAKLEARHKNKKNYASVMEIYDDIIDLAGVRIAVYFPKATEEVHAYIQGTFDVITEKKFPEKNKKDIYNKRFSGYGANHYRVKLKSEVLSSSTQHYSEGVIEIQIASVLMHAWAEVEHDLVYKPLSGKLSKEEYKILDELNGLVLTGELALERLQDAGRERITKDEEPFTNHYDLSSFLYSSLEERDTKKYEDLMLGDTRVLHVFLEKLNLNKASNIKPFIDQLNPEDEKRNITDQLVEHMIQGSKNKYEIYNEVKKEVQGRGYKIDRDNSEKENALGYFISRWIKLESLILTIGKHILPEEKYQSVLGKKFLSAVQLFDQATQLEIENLRRLRNHIIHGMKSPDEKILYNSGKYIDILIKSMPNEFPEYKDIINKILNDKDI